MAEFMRPTVTTEEVNDTIARFIVEPLERGFGYTLGNCMRRVLLSSLDGARATAIQIEGVQHEFTTAEGVIEDVTDIALNVKGLVFQALSEDYTEATATVSVEGPCTVTGADIQVPTEFTLVNPEHVICTVADGGTLNMTIRIGVGRGYVPAERNKRSEDPIGIIHVDSLFSPVQRCTADVSSTRVGQRTDFDKLVLEVATDGSITPDEAIALIEEKRTKESQRHIKTFAEEPGLEILNGRYGAYIAFEGSNYRLPKDVVPADLTLEDCRRIIAEAADKPKRRVPRRRSNG